MEILDGNGCSNPFAYFLLLSIPVMLTLCGEVGVLSVDSFMHVHNEVGDHANICGPSEHQRPWKYQWSELPPKIRVMSTGHAPTRDHVDACVSCYPQKPC